VTKETIGLLTAVAGLATGIVALATSLNNSVKISVQSADLKHQEAKLDELTQNASRIAMDLTVDTPAEGDKIDVDVLDTMKGSFVGTIPAGDRLYVLARDRYKFFLVYPPTQLSHAMKRWSQTNVRLPTDGKWELHVCIANAVGSAWLEGRAEANDWSGFAKLPDGVQTVRYVNVERVHRLTRR
jgi:hypothetical protein